MNRNTSIRFFNFAYNNLSSQIYEYSIKLGAIITRHPNLMHIDISMCGLLREEVLFLGLALTMSKTVLALHMTGNTIAYYDRMFLRSLMAAKVDYRFKSDQNRPELKNNKEFTQVLQMGGSKTYNKKIRDYISMYNDWDVERGELDVDIEEILTSYKMDEEFKCF